MLETRGKPGISAPDPCKNGKTICWTCVIDMLDGVCIIRGTKSPGGTVPHPFPPIPPIAREMRREVDTMTDLVLIAAILELASNVIGLIAVVMEVLPVREDREP